MFFKYIFKKKDLPCRFHADTKLILPNIVDEIKMHKFIKL